LTKLDQKRNNVKRPLVLDGAMGTLLLSRGLEGDDVLWTSILNLYSPTEVEKVHKEYIEAGADIITTNTFRTNPAAVEQSNYQIEVKEFVKKSVSLALHASEGTDVLIAGSNAPAEDCYQKEITLPRHKIEYNHAKHIELLWENGVDFILNETHSHLSEIEFVSRFCDANRLPFVTSIFFDSDFKLLSGEPLKAAVETVLSYSPVAVSFNCIKPEHFKKYDWQSFRFPWGFYFNCGKSEHTEKEITGTLSPKEYVEQIEPLLTADKEIVFVGSCCGSTPQHTKAIKEFLYERFKN